jgi:hypothetical protein
MLEKISVQKTIAQVFIGAMVLSAALIAQTLTEQYFSIDRINQLTNGQFSTALNADKKSQTVINGQTWNSYEQTLGKEKLSLSLPDIPVFTRLNDTWGTVIALKDKKIEYWLMAPMPAASKVQQETLFPMFIELHSKNPYKMMESSVNVDNKLPALDIKSYNQKTKKIELTRVLITNDNFYVTAIKYPKKLDGKVDANTFLDSVKVVQ